MEKPSFKPIIINKEATIISGEFQGLKGKVVGANWANRVITLETELGLIVEAWERVEQE